jgi:hypothetical protein
MLEHSPGARVDVASLFACEGATAFYARELSDDATMRARFSVTIAPLEYRLKASGIVWILFLELLAGVFFSHDRFSYG